MVGFGFPKADPLLAAFVALMIAKIGVDILRETLPVLVDRAAFMAKVQADAANPDSPMSGGDIAKLKRRARYGQVYLVMDGATVSSITASSSASSSRPILSSRKLPMPVCAATTVHPSSRAGSSRAGSPSSRLLTSDACGRPVHIDGTTAHLP